MLMKKTYKTEAAQVAALIKAELKVLYPSIAFSVKSQTYAGGNSVDVKYFKGKNSPDQKEIEKVAYKFKAGHFDGMTDMYEYTYKGTGPTANCIFVRAEYPTEVYKATQLEVSPNASPEVWRESLEKNLIAMAY